MLQRWFVLRDGEFTGLRVAGTGRTESEVDKLHRLRSHLCLFTRPRSALGDRPCPSVSMHVCVTFEL